LTALLAPLRLVAVSHGILTLILITLFSATLSAQGPATPPKVGEKAPDFALPNGDGKLIRLSEYTERGPVLLIFYRGYW
jgi:hypothetical protein